MYSESSNQANRHSGAEKTPNRFPLGKRNLDSLPPIDKYGHPSDSRLNRDSSGKKDSDPRDSSASGINQQSVGAVATGVVAGRVAREGRFGALGFDSGKDYKQEYLRIYLANLTVLDRIKQCKDENDTLRRRMVLPKVIRRVIAGSR